ncbi:GNAT family N-acetyltransferase [Symbiobacterium thermophilum]|nr:GNAT family N-acetyltransferase [Symbiobacterium thermophilum]
MVQIREASPSDYEGMLSVARSLPEWFNEQGLREMAADLRTHHGFVAVRRTGAEEQVVGFVTWLPRVGDVNLVELTWLGVTPQFQRRGLGRRLVEAVADRCGQIGVSVMEVTTLADSVDYAPYARTRAFYRTLGFRDWRVDADFYGPGDDRLVLRKYL